MTAVASAPSSRLVSGVLVALLAGLVGAAGCVGLMTQSLHGYGLAYLAAGTLTGVCVAALRPASRALPYLAGLVTLLSGPVVYLAGTTLGLYLFYGRSTAPMALADVVDKVVQPSELVGAWPMTQVFWVLAALTTFVVVRVRVGEVRRAAG